MDYKNEQIELNVPKVVDVQDFEVGVLIARMQVPELHPVHRELLKTVCDNHKKVILFLGMPVVEQTKRNPLDFASRKAMIQSEYPDITVLPIRDQRNNETWSKMLDNKIAEPFGNRTSLLYGSRDSFIPYYKGRHQTVELIGNNDVISGSAIRDEVAREVVESTDFRKGVIYANYGRFPVIMPCADIVVLNPTDNTLMLGRKHDEDKFRFIGGHVDVTDESYESAAIRELHEEAGGISIDNNIEYVCSGRIRDWRHRKEESEIFSTLFLATRLWGGEKAGDDIEEVKWVQLEEYMEYDEYSKLIIEEHLPFFGKLVEHLIKKLDMKLVILQKTL